MNGQEDVAGVLRNLSEINVVQVAVIVVAAWLLIVVSQRVLAWLADGFSGHRRHQILAGVPVVRLVVIVMALALALPRLIEPTFENLLALLGAVGLALGFAFKDYVSSLIAGIVTLYEMPYRLGDWIGVEGVYGEVTSIGMRTAEIVTLDDTVVRIPHLMVWDRLIHNANAGTTHLMCTTEFYLHPRHDGAQVEEALHRVALTSPYLNLSQPVNVAARETPWGTLYRLRAYPIDPRDQNRFTTDLTARGKGALTDLGVAFPAFPAVSDGAELPF